MAGGKRRLIPPRKQKFKKNATEERYEKEVLIPLRNSGDLIEFYYESWQFRIAERTTYLPDFVLIFPDRIEIHEVKGFWQQTGRVKWKACAEKYPWFVWKAVRWVNKQWQYETYGGDRVG